MYQLAITKLAGGGVRDQLTRLSLIGSDLTEARGRPVLIETDANLCQLGPQCFDFRTNTGPTAPLLVTRRDDFTTGRSRIEHCRQQTTDSIYNRDRKTLNVAFTGN